MFRPTRACEKTFLKQPRDKEPKIQDSVHLEAAWGRGGQEWSVQVDGEASVAFKSLS